MSSSSSVSNSQAGRTSRDTLISALYKDNANQVRSKLDGSASFRTKSKRCFDMDGNEETADYNYFSRVATPGPNSFRIYESATISCLPKVLTRPFSRTERILSESNRVFIKEDLEKPPVTAYSCRNSSTQEYLDINIKNIKWEINGKKEKMKKNGLYKDDKDFKLANRALFDRLNEEQIILQNMIEKKNLNVSKFPKPKTNSFLTSSKRDCLKSIGSYTKPHFYRSQQDWDFGYDKRDKTIEMNAFQYTDRFNELCADEERTFVDVAVGNIR